jgi:uncharacterized repeat protein (TIGR03803 family)
MKIPVGRLCSFTLTSLLSFISFTTQTRMQDYIFNQVGGPPALRGTTGKTIKAPASVAASGYSYSVLYNFCSAPNCTDGASPQAGLIQDAAGNLYGTTMAGGANSNPDSCNGCGTVFEVDNTGHESVLYSFCSNTVDGSPCLDGSNPKADLIQDAAGNIYGTTEFGGPNDGGTVFKVDNTGHETVLYSFCSDESNCVDGTSPQAGLIQDTAGNLYGTTLNGGSSYYTVGPGTAFKVGNNGNEMVVYSFCPEDSCPDGANPYAGLIQDAADNLYGTTSSGGAGVVAAECCGGGTVFMVDTTGHETVLYSFCSASNCTDGASPQARLIQDAADNLYSTTTAGGGNSNPSCGSNGCGTVFKLDNTGHETVLYSFCAAPNCTDGAVPQSGLILDAVGNLYGTAAVGGPNGRGGTVFKVTSPRLMITGTPMTVSPGATVTSTITVTPGAGFTGSVALTAAVTSSPANAQDPPRLSFGSTSPANITGASPVTATLTISTTAKTSGSLAYPARPGIGWYTASVACLAFVLLAGSPSRDRSGRIRLGILIFLMICIGGFIACGSGGSNGGAGGNPGTTPGTYTVMVTGSSGSATAMGAVTLMVQ